MESGPYGNKWCPLFLHKNIPLTLKFNLEAFSSDFISPILLKNFLNGILGNFFLKVYKEENSGFRCV